MWGVQVIAVAVRWLLKYVITKSLLFLGLGYGAYYGITEMYERFQFAVEGGLSGLPGDVFNFAMLCGFGEYVKITFSSFAAFFVVKGLHDGTKWVMRLNPIL